MIVLQQNIRWNESEGVRVYLPQSAINTSDEKEFIANAGFEASISGWRSEKILFRDVLRKSDFIRTFLDIKELIDIKPGQSILELGADHGWASVIIKDEHPEAYVVASDLVPKCIKHATRYENMIGRRLDEKWAFSVRDIPFSNAQFDRIFTFAAFHHFGDKGKYFQSLREISRVLKPNGKLVLLYEPSSPQYLYRSAYHRVNRRQATEGVDEDVLVVSKLSRIAEKLGMHAEAFPCPIYQYRSSVEASLYYYALSNFKQLTRLLPCTINMVFHKIPLEESILLD